MSQLQDYRGRIGALYGADGTYLQERSGNLAERIVQQAHGKYYEAVLRGNCYAAQTAATGVAPGTALGTTAAFTLYNPTGSARTLVIQRISLGYVSGTLGAGVVHIASDSTGAGAAVPTGTGITPRNLKVGGAGSSVATALTTATITTAAGKVIGILGSLQASLATTAVAPWLLEKDVDGEIILAAGGMMHLHATAAAGTAPLVVFNVTWEEVLLASQ